MKKIIKISGIDCQFKTSAALPRIYRRVFRRDIFNDLSSIQKAMKAQEKRKKELIESGVITEDEFESELPVSALETFENIAYTMHKHGDPTQPTTIEEWLEQFETFDIYTIFPEMLEMWGLENKQLSEAKNLEEK